MKKYVWILIGFFVLALLFFNCERQRANELSSKYLDEINKNALLVTEMAGIQSKLVGAVATEKDLQNLLKQSDRRVANLIKSRNEKIVEIDRLKIAFTALQTHFTTISTFDSAGACIVPIDTTIGKIRLLGQTICDSSGGVVDFDTLQIIPLRLQLYKTKIDKGLYRYYMGVGADSSFLSIDSLQVMFTEPKPSFWERHSWKIGVVAGAITVWLLK